MRATFVVTLPDGIERTRTTDTMAYTHAVVASDSVYSWHTTEANAVKALNTLRNRDSSKGLGAEVRPVAPQVKKATRKAAPAKAETKDEKPVKASAKASAKKTPRSRRRPRRRPCRLASGQSPARRSTRARQAWIDANGGMDKCRSQYNGGWDNATAGTDLKRAASGTASVAWMDGYTDRRANLGKEGIANKWAALRSTDAPALASSPEQAIQ